MIEGYFSLYSQYIVINACCLIEIRRMQRKHTLSIRSLLKCRSINMKKIKRLAINDKREY